jgi:hypothetical protein
MLLSSYLDEAYFLGIAAEAPPTAHQSILPDYPMRVSTHSAANKGIPSQKNRNAIT